MPLVLFLVSVFLNTFHALEQQHLNPAENKLLSDKQIHVPEEGGRNVRRYHLFSLTSNTNGKLLHFRLLVKINHYCNFVPSRDSKQTLVVFSFQTFTAPPTFTDTPPQYVEAKEGGSITLTCTAFGNPKPSVSWLREGNLMVSSAKYKVYPWCFDVCICSAIVLW